MTSYPLACLEPPTYLPLKRQKKELTSSRKKHRPLEQGWAGLSRSEHTRLVSSTCHGRSDRAASDGTAIIHVNPVSIPVQCSNL